MRATIWTRETIVDAIRAWDDFHGQVPRMRDVMSSGGQLPHTKAVYRCFPDGWRSAIAASGRTFVPARPGPKPRPVAPPERPCDVCRDPMVDDGASTTCGLCLEELEVARRTAA